MNLTLSPTAHPGREPRSEAKIRRYAVFRRRQQYFGLSIELVREVLSGTPLTRVPRAGAEMQGVLSLRGEILPVVLIDRWLGLRHQPDDPQLPILVLRRGELLVGLRVDAIQGVVNVPTAQIQTHPAVGADSVLLGLWQSQGQAPVNLIDGPALLEALCRETSTNL